MVSHEVLQISSPYIFSGDVSVPTCHFLTPSWHRIHIMYLQMTMFSDVVATDALFNIKAISFLNSINYDRTHWQDIRKLELINKMKFKNETLKNSDFPPPIPKRYARCWLTKTWPYIPLQYRQLKLFTCKLKMWWQTDFSGCNEKL